MLGISVPICRRFNSKTKKSREIRLWHLIIETALQPPQLPSTLYMSRLYTLYRLRRYTVQECATRQCHLLVRRNWRQMHCSSPIPPKQQILNASHSSSYKKPSSSSRFKSLTVSQKIGWYSDQSTGYSQTLTDTTCFYQQSRITDSGTTFGSIESDSTAICNIDVVFGVHFWVSYCLHTNYP